MGKGELWEGPGIAGLCDFEAIGRGGFSVVYRARQESLDRPVAVKLLLADLSDEKDIRRFRRECAVLGLLGRHRHIVDVYDAGVTQEHRPYIVMCLYERGTVAQRLRDTGACSAQETVAILRAVADALQVAHDHDVVHRDIKPENLLIDDDGSVVLTDFGVAVLTDAGATVTTSAAYTESYVAPEVLESNRFSKASDIYALAATGYAMLTGQAPFSSTTGSKRLIAISSQPPAPITTPGVPQELAEVIIAAMAKDPADRVGSAVGFAEQLQQGLSDAEDRKPGAARVSAGDDEVRRTATAERTTVKSAGQTAADPGGSGPQSWHVAPSSTPPESSGPGSLTRECRHCGAVLAGLGRFCPACGAKQTTPATEPTDRPSDPPVEATRLKHVDEVEEESRVATAGTPTQSPAEPLWRHAERRKPADNARRPDSARAGSTAEACRYCGAPLGKLGVFCTSCGKLQKTASQSSSEPVEPTQRKPAPQTDAPVQPRLVGEVLAQARTPGGNGGGPGSHSRDPGTAMEAGALRSGWQDLDKPETGPPDAPESKVLSSLAEADEQPRRRRNIWLALIGGLVLLAGVIYTGMQMAGYSLVTGDKAAHKVVDALDNTIDDDFVVHCPFAFLREGRAIKCEVVRVADGAALGTAEVALIGGAPSVTYEASSAAQSAAAAEPTESPTTAPSVSPLAEARASFATLKSRHPAHKFSRVQPYGENPWAISIKGRKAYDWTWYDEWERTDRLLNMNDVWFKRIQEADTVGNWRRDFLLLGEDSDGEPYGSLLMNEGGWTRQVVFSDSEGKYGAAAHLEWTGSELISDYGSHGHASSPGGYARTKWVPKKGKKHVLVEQPA